MKERIDIRHVRLVLIPAAVAVLLLIDVFACAPHAEVLEKGSSQGDTALCVEIIRSQKNTYGYNILVNGKTVIHQLHMPALPGTKGFGTEEATRRVAAFVILKIRNGIFPPSISIKDLDSLGVLANDKQD